MPMRNRLSLGVVMVSLALSSMVYAQEVKLGSSVEGLLQAARERNPEIASMRFDADAAAERVVPAGALPDPKFSMELRDLTRMGERNPTLLPSSTCLTAQTWLALLPGLLSTKASLLQWPVLRMLARMPTCLTSPPLAKLLCRLPVKSV